MPSWRSCLTAPLLRPMRVRRYEAADELPLAVTGVFPACPAQVTPAVDAPV